ncbi:MAG: glycosyltransferase family 2 protein [Bacteroidia bacterium]|nr:glycosyltransferase family 2 protein [Bacteroidia bacterium]
MNTGKPPISIVLPIYNEEKNIPVLYERLHKVLSANFQDYEVVFINDGSSDNTLTFLKSICEKDKHFKYISFSRNFGHQTALLAGLHHAKGDAVLSMDSDLQDPPELIPVMYNKLKEGYDMVYAKRAERKGETFFKKFTAKIFYRLLKSLSNIDIPLDTGDFRIMSRKMLNAFNSMKERNLYIRGQMAWLGFRTTYILYDRDPRYSGETKYTLKKMIKLAINGITGFSSFPLQIASFFGMMFSMVAFLFMLKIIYSKIFEPENLVSGWASIMVSVMFIGGVQLLCIGIIGEYINKIINEVKERPFYIIDETNIQ